MSEDVLESLKRAPTEQELRNVYAQARREFVDAMKTLGELPKEERKARGKAINDRKAAVDEAFARCLEELQRRAREADLHARPFDLTLPARPLAPLGHKHPIMRVREEIVDVFRGLGFAVHEGPEVELEENNFDKLGYPPDHPATDMQDTFWVKRKGDPEDLRVLLRSHTSNVQVRAMSTKKPPFAFMAPGAVYRRDDDVTHSPMFHQLEAFLVDERVSMAHLKGVLAEFAERLYGPGTPVRLRPSYFPFTEPSAEVDIGCICRGKGCNVCKGTGWLEILGCGMIHPVVFEHCGIDPEKYTGFALGMGIERVAMLRYGIGDIRLLFENDPRFLAQF